MSQNTTPPVQAAETVDAATRAAAAKALLDQLANKTKQAIQDNPDVLKGVPGGIAGATPK